MAQKHTLEELNNCSREELITIVLMCWFFVIMPTDVRLYTANKSKEI